ncbi:acetylcholinesterase [Moesziomyces antarcticus T-34]|uniref:Carboxylic ester hydrolase n=1 Tax=Pseudozyma antarctica (strain T-34) TaxID=1151754 RepID=M9MHK2_PSEA3|nr:acetylcholinesterase [Moesziomyces antarcticus T-34]
MTDSSAAHDVVLPLQGRIRPRRVHLPAFLPSTSPGSVLAYLGIPFAQPPVGARRWQAPQGPLPSWPSVRTSTFGADPHQDFAAMEGMYRGRTSAKTTIPRTEDCLYLNVWVPTTPCSTPRPVLVWIYGGAFAVGNCSRPLHDGARLAHESGCIVVSITYRVGAMGFLGSRALVAAAGDWPLLSVDALHTKPSAAQVGAGNWGLWDIVAGLVWVQGSIGAFGGDAHNVTVFGESAGSIAIHYLLLSKAVPAGLFHKAVLQSGVVATLLPRTTHASQACWDFLVRALCPHLEGDDEAQVEYMRTRVRADQIDAALRPLIGKRPRSEYTPTRADVQRLPAAREDADEPLGVTDQWGPVWDGVLVDADFVARAMGPLPPRSELRNGRGGVVLGLCADEGTMFNFLVATSNALLEHQALFHPSLAADMAAMYGYNAEALAQPLQGRDKTERDRAAAYTCATYTGDAQFTAPILDYMAAQRQQRGDVAVYGYLLAHRPSWGMLDALTVVPEMTEDWAAFHTLDIPLVFGLTGSSSGEAHAWAGDMAQYGTDAVDEAKTAAVLSEQRGMSSAERQLSMTMMRTWAAIARLEGKLVLPDASVWAPLGSSRTNGDPGNIGNIELLAFGEAPQAPVPLLRESNEVRVWQTQLGEHPFAQHAPVGAALLHQRVQFWLHQPISGTSKQTCRAMQNYYGWINEPPRFLPWPQG